MRRYLLLFMMAFPGCGTSDPCAADPMRCSDAGGDAGPSGPGSCTGVCVAPAPSGWYATSLLWIGEEGAAAPACPSFMPAPFDGFADTPPNVVCPTCDCAPSSAACLLPHQMFANAGVCPGDGSSSQSFDAPLGWNGACNVMDPVSSASSLTVSPPAVPGTNYCQAVVSGPTIIEGTTPARVCQSPTNSVAPGSCGDQTMVCAFPPAEEYLTCIVRPGDNDCPEGWPTKHIVYEDASACGCVCGDPIGDSCSATITVYEDSACTKPLGSVSVSSDQPAGCVDVAPGSAFGSKSSTLPIYKAGICTPKTYQIAPDTFCCLP